MVLDSSSQILVINGTDAEGLYTCLASNECGTALQEFEVIIPSKLHQIIVPENRCSQSGITSKTMLFKSLRNGGISYLTICGMF